MNYPIATSNSINDGYVKWSVYGTLADQRLNKFVKLCLNRFEETKLKKPLPITHTCYMLIT